MNIIFVQPDTMVQSVAFSSSSMNLNSHFIDFTKGIDDFCHFWGSIDQQAHLFDLTVSSQTLKEKFWDRFDFIDFLKANCQYDVIIKVNYGLELSFLSSKDGQLISEMLYNRAVIDCLELPKDLKSAVRKWLNDNQYTEYRIVDNGWNSESFRLSIRDEGAVVLANVKFANTTPEIHAEHEPYDDVPF